jgi:hypothetical protein
MTDLRWWPTTWGRITVGDQVQDPRERTWTVQTSIRHDGAGAYLISDGITSAWTTQRDDAPVSARRPAHRDDPRAMNMALASLAPLLDRDLGAVA